MSRRDDLPDELGAALGAEREPPEDRVAALRARAQERRTALAVERAAPPPRRAGVPRRQLLAGGAAASLGVALGAAGYAALDDDPAEPLEPVAVAVLRDGVRARARVIDHTWGVEYVLEVTGLPPGRAYEVVYRTVDGADVGAGSFLGTPGTVVCRMTGAVLRDRTRAIEVLDADGAALLRSALA